LVAGGMFLLGRELSVRRMGYGAMRILGDREVARAVLQRAVELGVNLIDTAGLLRRRPQRGVPVLLVSSPLRAKLRATVPVV
jgi:predicted aldo/keto reductase-like oxidoreductase